MKYHRRRAGWLWLVILVALSGNSVVWGQWSEGVYGNEWIDYRKDYLRIQVTQTGVQRLLVSDLPGDWRSTDPQKWQLWRRGKEIAIIKADQTEIVFYGETNDGASDSLLYRPYTARLNPYVSLFSDQGVYFLTTASQPKRARTGNEGLTDGKGLPFHYQQKTATFSDQFSWVTWLASNDLNQSYYTEGNSWTGPTIAGPKAHTGAGIVNNLSLEFTLEDLYTQSDAPKPSVEMLFNAVLNGLHDIKVEAGPAAGPTRKVSGAAFNGWGGRKVSFEMNSTDLSAEGKGVFKLYSESESTIDWFSISYYTIYYPQRPDMRSQGSKRFTFAAGDTEGNYKIEVRNVPENTVFYDISDKSAVSVLNAVRKGDGVELLFNKAGKNKTEILGVVPSEYVKLTGQNVGTVSLRPVYTTDAGINTGNGAPSSSAYDYIMISNSKYRDGTVEYARYRSGESGGEHRVLVMDIRDIYDQFNYGEPSPVAIRMFMKYMLRDGIRDGRHYLVLIGTGVSYPPNVRKELLDEIPTFGDPGSDNLLVAGLNNTNKDLQAVPVGRIKAFSNDEVRAYLDKVKIYESSQPDISWRKKVLHLSGGHSASEITTLKNALSVLEPIVQESEYGGKVSPLVKTITSVEQVDISPQVNDGVGLISFFGHGSQRVTDMDFGFATDASRGYLNKDKYPMMYFNGCGVGNLFTSRSVHALSDDWLIAKDKGAISVIANSYLSFVSPSARHISQLYRSLFENAEIKSIGHALRDANAELLRQGVSEYDIANMHQAVLQGDPALKLLRVEEPDYIIDADDGILIYAADRSKTIGASEKLKVAVVVRNGGKWQKNTTLPVEFTYRYKDGTVTRNQLSVAAMSFSDTIWVEMDKNEQLERIEARANPDYEISEFSYTNNIGELVLDWEASRSQNFYPSTPARDLIKPVLTARFDGKPAKNRSVLPVNTGVSVLLQDDRLMVADTALIEVYLRPCWTDECDYSRLFYNSALEMTESADGRSLLVHWNTEGLQAGDYEMLVQGRDRAGNGLIYNIQFRIDGTASENAEVLASPNPTADFVKFSLQKVALSEIERLTFSVHSPDGRMIHSENFTPDNGLTTEWYWRPVNLGSGIYLSQVTIQYKSQRTEVIRKRIVRIP